MAGVVRQPIDTAALNAYIKKNLPEIGTPVDLKQFGHGQSNPTYQLTSPDGRKYVLRKKPPGTLFSKTAHQIEREYQILHALRNTDVPVPQTYCLCEDSSIIGTPFYIMEFLDGRIISDAWIPNLSASERRAMWYEAVRTLSKLHSVDPKAVGLENFGRPSGYYDRQIKALTRVSEVQSKAVDVKTGAAVGPIPHYQDLISFFSQRSTQPKDRSTLVHGDYKIDNLVFHKTEPRVIGILDWEMATIGHPLSDFVNLTSPFSWAKTDYVSSPQQWMTADLVEVQNMFAPGTVGGLPSLDQCLDWYAEDAGWNPRRELEWGNAFGNFRSAVIMQGIAARYALGQASGIMAREYAAQMVPYGMWSWARVEELKNRMDCRPRL